MIEICQVVPEKITLQHRKCMFTDMVILGKSFGHHPGELHNCEMHYGMNVCALVAIEGSKGP